MATTRSRPPAPGPYPARQPGPPPPPRGTAQRTLDLIKRWAIPIVAGITPVALIAINIAVWINDHIGMLRLWVAIAAFVSGMMFNSWIGLSLYRWVQRRRPDWSLVSEANQEVVLVVGMGLITLITFLTSLALYIGLRDATSLPNAWTLWWGIIQIAYPFVLKIYVDWDQQRKAGPRRWQGARPDDRATGPGSPGQWGQQPGAGAVQQPYPPAPGTGTWHPAQPPPPGSPPSPPQYPPAPLPPPQQPPDRGYLPPS